MDNIKSLNVPPSTTLNSILTIPLLIFFLGNRCISQIATMKSSIIPIRGVTKRKCCKRSKNVFYDDSRFSDKTDDYNNCLNNIGSGVILQQKKSPIPQLDVIDLEFHYDFDETLHGVQLAKDLDVSHLNPSQAAQLIALIKQYWTIFNDRGTFTPMHSYQCVIDTGNAKLIAVKKIM
jgi:hypothetical protein